MKLPEHDAFHIKTIADLRGEIARLKLDIKVADDLACLYAPLKAGNLNLPNRLCALPMEGRDANADGAPGPLTLRRYERYARGGFSLIWIEAAAVTASARRGNNTLFLNDNTVDAFARFVVAIRLAAKSAGKPAPILILQLAHAGRHGNPPAIAHGGVPSVHKPGGAESSVATDAELDLLADCYVGSAKLAERAGFDGVDVKCCHGDLVSDLLAAFSRPGKYGGRFENRARFLLDVVAGIHQAVPRVAVAVRLGAYDGNVMGFGVDRDDPTTPDLSEPIRLAKLLQAAGVSLLGVTASTPRTRESELPLVSIDRLSTICGAIQEAVPGLPVVCGGMSWLRQFLPDVAAGLVGEGKAGIVGLGRAALAYPDAAADILKMGKLDANKCCITCLACDQLHETGYSTGCVIRDEAVYGEQYRRCRHFSVENLREEALRCHFCEAAACSEGCPSHIDVPAFIEAFSEGNIAAAYGILRQSNVLPEMCSHLCPTWLTCEGPCIERILTGRSIPIRDIQYAVSWLARTQGLVKTEIPKVASGKKVAVVGAGPAGIACAVRLVECGHNVVILERTGKPGGTPELTIRSNRYPGAGPEIEAVLEEPVLAGRLEIRLNQELGTTTSLADLTQTFDAVLVAAGVWNEKELCQGKKRPAAVIGGLDFLEQVKSGRISSVPDRVAILAGGDSAMDAADAALSLGAKELYVVYGGPLSQMHWHMPDSWFRKPGVHCMTLSRPMGYRVDAGGNLTALQICRTEPVEGRFIDSAGSESFLQVGMVIEAMELGISEHERKALAGVELGDDGLVRTMEPGSFATSLAKVFVAGGLINGGATAAQCIAEGMKAAEEIDKLIGHARL